MARLVKIRTVDANGNSLASWIDESLLSGGGSGAAWGGITGTLSGQTDLQSALNAKVPTSYLDTDTSLTANSDSKIATQKATKAYVLANAGGGGLTSSTAIALLASVSVNLNEGTAAKQTLYTVPGSKIFILDHLVFRNASGTNNNAIVSFGVNAGATGFGGSTLSGFAAGGYMPVNPASIEMTAAQVFGLAVDTPEGSALTATVDVFGYLIAA